MMKAILRISLILSWLFSFISVYAASDYRVVTSVPPPFQKDATSSVSSPSSEIRYVREEKLLKKENKTTLEPTEEQQIEPLRSKHVHSTPTHYQSKRKEHSLAGQIVRAIGMQILLEVAIRVIAEIILLTVSAIIG